ncbi:50S ribosomal protein L1 [candidate division Kazan bacterium]|uniref:Large ribosomal subunit protein uL1 n=1 Tax=candidate division Kazan bacterium TaxID=2202143 RepID=A0A420ZCV3_UNCK3|nr:MAG: 50S ribosomal protein L1 [candidate division Kazan bacterium]
MGRKYAEAVAKVDKKKLYSVDEALKLVRETSPVKFDATVELHVQMGLDPKQADQNIRGTVNMPAGTGKVQKVLVIAGEADAQKAAAAGADFVGLDDIIEKIEKGWMDFDVVIATPDVMPKVGKLGQTLGTKGMMPNPKSGTITKDIEKVVKEFKAGKIEFRLDKDAIIHLGLGKVSFKLEDLKDNFNALMAAIKTAKPASAKGTYIKRITLTSTMGPGVNVDVTSI